VRREEATSWNQRALATLARLLGLNGQELRLHMELRRIGQMRDSCDDQNINSGVITGRFLVLAGETQRKILVVDDFRLLKCELLH